MRTGWPGYPVEIEILVIVMALSIPVLAILRAVRRDPYDPDDPWILAPKYIGLIAFLLAAFAYVLSADTDYVLQVTPGITSHSVARALRLLTAGIGLCIFGFLVSWGLEWICERRGRSGR